MGLQFVTSFVSLGPVINNLAIFSYAYILKIKRIKYTTSKVSVVRC